MKQSSKPPQMAEVEESIDAMEAAVIAELVKSGVSFADAKAQVLGGQKAPAVEDEVDIEPPVIPQKSNDFSDAQIHLFDKLKELESMDGGEHEISSVVPTHIMIWVIRRTLQEAYKRNDPNFVVENFILLLLKEQRAIDPTKAGQVTAASSGPKQLFNPGTGKWG